MWSIVAAWFATTAGCRYVTPRTITPQRSRRVLEAIAARSAIPSKHGPSGSLSIGRKWSKTEAQSKPRCSAACQSAT